MIGRLRAATLRTSTLDPARWARALDALADLGFDAVDLSAVWREHEIAPGRFDFQAPRRDLAAAVRAARAGGLRVLLRLGPMATPEAPGLGLPERVLRDPGFAARTRRNNPIVVPDGLRLVPLPSLASRGFRHESRQWITGALEALGDTLGEVDRVIVGEALPLRLRDAPGDDDHHPDASRPPEGPSNPLGETVRVLDYLRDLADAARAAGCPHDRLAYAWSGPVLGSAAAATLGAEGPVVFTAPPPRAGVETLWREFRAAAVFPAGCIVTLRAGTAPIEPPVPSSHARSVARIALAAGLDAVSVQMGCAGEGWVGALLNEEAHPRPHAARWSELLRAAEAFPQGTEPVVPTVVPRVTLESRRAAAASGPLPLGLLSRLGISALELDPTPQSDRLPPAAEALPRVDATDLPLGSRFVAMEPAEAPRLRVDPPATVYARCVRVGPDTHWIALHDHPLPLSLTSPAGSTVRAEAGVPVLWRDVEGAR